MRTHSPRAYRRRPAHLRVAGNRFCRAGLLPVALAVLVAGIWSPLARAAEPPARPRSITVAGGHFRPLLFLNADGEPDGMFADFWWLWSAKTGVQVELRLMDWADAIPSLLAGEVDAVDGVSYTAERAEFLDLTEPHDELPTYIYFHQSLGGVRGLPALAGFPIGVLGGSYAIDHLHKKAPTVRPVLYPTYEGVVQAAIQGRLQTFVGEEPVVSFLFAEAGVKNEFRRVETPLLTNDMRTAVRKGEVALLALIQEGHGAITPAERKEIQDAWSGLPLTRPIPWRWFAGGALVLLAGLALLALWITQLRRQVAAATHTLRMNEAVLRSRNEELEALNQRLQNVIDASKELAACSSVERLGQVAMGQFTRLVGAEGGGLFIRRDDALVLVAALDPGHTPREIPLPLVADSVLGRVWERKSPLLVFDVTADSRMSRSGWDGYREGSLLALPLLDDHGEMTGAISLHNKGAPPFSPQDRDLGMILGSLCAETMRTLEAVGELRTSEAKYRELVENANSIIIRMDTKGVVTFINEYAQSFFGFSEVDILGRNVVGSIVPEYDQAGRDLSMMIADIGKSPEHYAANENENVCRSGERVWVTWTNKPVVDELGRVVEILCVGNDITGRKRLEEQLRQSQKMEAVGQLAGGVAHDFNNILQAILGYTGLVLGELTPEDRHRSELEEVYRSAEKAGALTRQLLAFSRRQVIRPIPLDLNEVVAGLMNILCRVIGEHIQLDIVPGHDLGTVYADETQIEQVLMNLCVNARDAMPDGGSLTVETENVTLDGDYVGSHMGTREGPHVLLTVTDVGRGMDKEAQEHAFDPFFTTKEVGEGTGLGLATVYGIVKQHGGSISVYSEVGKGTVIKVYLPVSEGRSKPVQDATSDPPQGGTETILVAEDDETILTLAERILVAAGYTVLTARDGEEALAVFAAHETEIDLALLDVVMPRLGGRDVQRQIKEKRSDVRFLFASGYSPNAIHTNFVLKEGMQLIQKPYQREALLKEVRAVLDG